MDSASSPPAASEDVLLLEPDPAPCPEPQRFGQRPKTWDELKRCRPMPEVCLTPGHHCGQRARRDDVLRAHRGEHFWTAAFILFCMLDGGAWCSSAYLSSTIVTVSANEFP